MLAQRLGREMRKILADQEYLVEELSENDTEFNERYELEFLTVQSMVSFLGQTIDLVDRALIQLKEFVRDSKRILVNRKKAMPLLNFALRDDETRNATAKNLCVSTRCGLSYIEDQFTTIRFKKRIKYSLDNLIEDGLLLRRATESMRKLEQTIHGTLSPYATKIHDFKQRLNDFVDNATTKFFRKQLGELIGESEKLHAELLKLNMEMWNVKKIFKTGVEKAWVRIVKEHDTVEP